MIGGLTDWETYDLAIKIVLPIFLTVMTIITGLVFRKLEVIRVDVNSNLQALKDELAETISLLEKSEEKVERLEE